MRLASYFFAALISVSTAFSAAIPADQESNAPKPITLSELDLEPVSYKEAEKRTAVDATKEFIEDTYVPGAVVCRNSKDKRLERRDPRKTADGCFTVYSPLGRCINLKSSDGQPFVSAKPLSTNHGWVECKAYADKGCDEANNHEVISSDKSLSFNVESVGCW